MKEEHIFNFNGIVASSCLDQKDLYLFAVTWSGNLSIFDVHSKEQVGILSMKNNRFHMIKLST